MGMFFHSADGAPERPADPAVRRANLRRIGYKGAHHGDIFLYMPAEIVKWVGMPALDDGVSFAREFIHDGLPSVREMMRSVPASGTCSQSGRCANSYSIS